MITAGTYGKEHFFRGAERLDLLQNKLLFYAKESGWQLEAWAVFSNHYHFVGHSPSSGATTLSTFIAKFHQKTASLINRLYDQRGRKVWHNFWDTKLTYERSYLARLNYVHQNAVLHGLVKVANAYRWCSAGWFERTATSAQVKTIYGFKVDGVSVVDEYEPV